MPPGPGLKPNVLSLQRWSSQTLILLSTSVGLSTYILGFSAGHKAGLRKASEGAALGVPLSNLPSGVPVPAFPALVPSSPAQSGRAPQ
ncbi:hypothetical protein OC861_000575 [Tilletia horrida]|nr:hypothetical protein OC861_000575 [Tilletia horrida]